MTNGTLGMVVTSAGKIALQASGTTSLNLGSGFITPTVNSLSVSYNNTGADVNRTVSVTVGASTLSAPVNVLNGVTAVVANGLNAQVANFVTLSGNFAFQTSGGDIIAAATGAAASMSVSSVVHAGLSNATLGLLLKSNGTLAIDGSGAVDINLGPSFGSSVTASSVTVKYNNTGADVARTLTIGSISAPLNALNNVSVVSAAGFNATINNFVTVTGDLGFKKTSDGLVVVGQNVDARLAVGSVLAVGITSGNLGMIINSANRVVLEADGGLVLNLGSGSFTVGTVTADKVKVEFNNTGADVNTTVTVGSLSQVINVKKSTISVSAFNFHAQILNFIDISGDLSFKKLTLGDFNLPNFPSLPTWDPSLPNVNLPTIPDLGGVNLPTLPGLPGLPAWPTANLPDFPELNLAGLPSLPSLPSLPNLGDFGLGGFSIAGINMGINLSIPGFSIGTINADFGLLMDSFGKFALDIHGLPSFSVGLADIGKIGAHDVEVKFNNTGVDVNGSANDVNGNAKSVQVAKGLAQVNIDGFYAVLNNVFQINGDFGFQLGANRTELIGVGQNISAKLLPTTSSSVIDLGITGGTMAMVVKKGATLTSKPTIAVSADGTFKASLGGGLVGVSATSAGISFNNTGVDEDCSFTVGSITQSLKAKAGVTAVTATGLSATIDQFVTLSGDFAFQQSTGGDINVIANGASATLTAGSQSIGVTGATLGMILKADGKIAMQASGQRAMNLGTGFASVSATLVTVAYNNTGADVNTTLTTGAVSAAINVTNNTTAITATGFVATISQFVTVSGDFSFKKTTGGDIVLAGTGASAQLTAGTTIQIGVSNATIGLLIKSNSTIALDASGAFGMNLGTNFVGASATNVTVKYNNTGADVNTSVTVGAVTASINVANGVTAISTTGFTATIVNFVTLSGNFGFQKTTDGDIIVAATGASASLNAGTSLFIGVSTATLGLLIKADGTLALQASGAFAMNLGSGLAGATATKVTVAYNNTQSDVATTAIVGAVSAPINVLKGVTAVTATGFNATIANFVTLTGDYGFQKSAGGDLWVVAQNAGASLTAGSLSVGVTGASLGLIIKAAGTLALQASGPLNLNLGTSFGNVSATSVSVAYNNTGADVNTTVAVGTLSAPVVVQNNTTAVSVIGLNATITNFVTLTGDFGFQKNSGGDFAVAANGASATLTAGSVQVGVNSATFGMIVKSGGGIAWQASGTPVLSLSSNFSNISATSVTVTYNNTGADVNTSVTIGSIVAPIVVANGTTAISVTGFKATVLNFVSISGNFGFKKTSAGDIIIAGSGASATLTSGSYAVGVTNATLGLILQSGGGTIFQASGTPLLNLPVSLGGISANTVSVLYNNTATAVNTTITIGSITATVNVAANTTAVSVQGFQASISNFVTLSGDFGFSKTTGGDLDVVVNGASATLTAVGLTVGVTNATMAMLVKSDGTLAIQASGTPVLTLPSDVTSIIDLKVTDLQVSYNSTGGALNTSLSIGSLSAPLNVATGNSANPYLSIAGSGSLNIAGLVTVSGTFGFSKIVDAASNTTKILVGASNVQGQANSNAYGVTAGTLGLALFRKTSTNTSLGYALDGSLTGFAQGGSASAQATINIRRNTTTFAVNEQAPVLTTNIPVVFSATEVAKNGTPFNSISLADAVIKIGDITVKGSYTSQPNGPSGESITTITKASLVFGDPALFTLNADSVTYKSYTSSVTLGGVTYADGVQQVIVTNGQIQLGDVVTLFGSFNIVRSKTAGTTLTNVGFTGLGISLKVDGRVMVTVAGDGMFHYGGPDGFKLDSFLPTTFDILPDRQAGSTPAAPAATASALSDSGAQAPAVTAAAPGASTTSGSPPKTITLGPLTLTNPNVTLTNFGLGFSNGQIVLKTTVTIGVESATLLSSGGSGAKITDGSDPDKFGIAGSFEMDLLLDPANNFKPSGVNTGNFKLMVDHFELDLGSFLIFTADKFQFNPDASSTDAMFYFGSVSVALNAGPLAIGGGASDFSIMGDGTFVAGSNFAVTLTLGSGTDATSTFQTPAWMPLKDLSVTLRWENDNFTKDPSKFLIVLDAQVASLGGLSGVSVSGGFTGLTIDVAKLAAGEFPIIDIGSANISIQGSAFGGGLSGSLLLGVVKLDADSNVIPDGSSTPVARRVLYGAVEGSYSAPSFGTLDIRIGFSDFGPLDVFISLDRLITLNQATGLAIKKIRGGIQFGSDISVPDPTVYETDSNGQVVIDPATGAPKIDAKLTAFALRDAAQAIPIPGNLTIDQWNQDLIQRIATLEKNNGGGDLSFSDLSKNIIIFAHADLIDRYAPDPLVFRGDVNFILDPTGKMMIYGTTTYADTLTNATYFYGDLSKIADGTGNFVFLMEKPFLTTMAEGGISYYGVLDFGLVDSTGQRLTISQLEDRYNVTNTSSESFVWNSSTTSLLLQHNALSTQPVTVTVGSATLTASDYTITKGNILTLNSKPNAGDVVSVNYSYTAPYGTDANGNPIANPNSTTPAPAGFQILVTGGVHADIFDNTLFYELDGEVVLTFTSTFFKVDVVAELQVSYLGVVGAAVGSLTVQYAGGFAIWGALKIASGDGLRKLQDYGINIQAQVTITINTTSQDKVLDLQLPATKQAHTTDTFNLAAGDLPLLYMSHSVQDGHSITVTDGGKTLVEGTDYTFDAKNSIITLSDGTKTARSLTVDYDSQDYLALHVVAAPESLNVVATVLATFSVGNTEFFRMQAALSMTISSQGFSLILVGKLMVGPAGNPFLTFDTTAIIFAGMINGKGGFAAMFKASLDVDLGPFALKADVLVQVNTFGQAVVLNIPNVNPAFPAITDENGQSLEKVVQVTTLLTNADGSPRLDANGNQMTMTVPTRTVSISGGAPRLQGGYEPDAPYFVLRGKGSLDLVSAQVSGQIYISLTPSKFHINLAGEIISGGNSFLASGDFNMVYGAGTLYVFGGVLAKRETGSGDPLEAYGVSVSGSGVILLNTDTVAHRITLVVPAIGTHPAGSQDFDIDPGFVFEASVVATFSIVGGIELFRIEGALYLQISTNPVGFKLLIQGTLKIGPENAPLFTFDANAAIYAGQLKDGKGGFAAMIHVSLNASALPGVTISGGFLFMTNTFGEDVTFDLGEKGDAAFTLPTIVDEKGNSVETERNTNKQAVDSNGKLLFDSNGNPVWQLDNNGNPIPVTYRQVTITGAAPNLSGGTEAASPYLFIRGSGDVNILDSFTFSGSFGILLTPTKFQLSVSATIHLGPFGDVDANGFMEISANGIVGAISLTVDTGKFGQAIGLKFDASFTFVVDTVGEKRTVTFLDGSTLDVDPGALIKVDGTITFAGVLDAEAHVAISFSNNKFQLDGTASINIAGGLIKSSIDLHVIVGDNGFALVTDIDVNTTLADVIKITASGHLYINTGSNSVTLGGVTLDAKSVFFKLDGKLALLDIFKFDVSVTAQVGGTFQRPGLDDRHLDVGQWAFSFNASVNFYDLATVSIGGWIMYDGSFGVSLSGGILLGSHYLGFGLDMSASISYDAPTDDLQFSASVTGTVYILGFSASISLNFDYDSSSGEITLSASASGSSDGGKSTTTHNHGWTIGYLTKPVPVYLATDNKGNRISDGANVGASGELDLTIGDGAKRNYLPNVQDDTYMVNHVSTQSDGSETVMVSFAGRSAEYSGVRKIVSHGGPGNETLYIQDGVTSQLQLDLGGGNDTIMVSGGSTTLTNTINGGDGNDLITISPGNTRSYTISGGAGINTLIGGNGNDTFYAGPGTDYITGGLGADTIYTGTGHAYILADGGSITTADGSSAPLSMISSGAGGNDTIYASTGTNFIIGGQGSDKIYGGGNNVIIGDDGEIDFDSSGNVTTATSTGSTGGNDYIDSLGGTGTSIILAGAGSDTIKGGDGTNIVLGDNGTANFANGQLTDISSTDSTGFDDTITLGNGLNVALGGGGNDTITGGNGKNIFGGDNGKATFDSNANLMTFTDGGTNGDDILNAGAGNNVIIGGGGNDTITAGAGNNVLIGDEGTATFNAGGFLINITSSNPSNAGNDKITAGNGTNVIIGGSGQDIITLGIGNAYVIGDNGNASFSATGIISNITTSDSSFGDADTITGSSGNDVIFGGTGADIINVNDYGDVIVGDNGNANFDGAGRLTSVSTSDASIGSADTITTGIGSNVVLGGAGADTIQAGNGNNIILGDCGNVSFLTSTGKSILRNINSTDASVGGGDNITVGNGRNIVFGGAGSDTINSGAGFNILVGDSGRAAFDNSGLLLNIATSDAAFGSADQITSTDGRSVILGGAGADNIRTGQGDSVIIGDNGTATFVSAGGSPSSIGNIVFSNDGILTYASTTDPTIGDNDVIVAGSGNNVILGGIGADQISTGDRNNVIIGDNGNATFDNTGVLILIQSSDASLPGAYDDIIIAGRGSNTIIGGNGADSIQTGTGLGTDIILGDNGKAVFDSTLGASILRDIISTDTSIGGNDLITAGNGFNVIVGGFGADHILGGDNTDVVLGDNGHGVFNATGILTFITTIDPTIGGNDYIDTGSGNNTVLGGTGADQIFSKGGTDVIVGDNGNATFTNTGLLTFITTSDVLSGGDDIIHAGDGFNTILGGSGADQIIGGANTDVVIGDNGNATFDPSSGDSILRDIISTDVSVGGDDIINVGDGSNVVLGGYGADQVTGGVDQDVVLGDNGHGIFNVQGILTYITTISPDVGGDDVINVSDGTNVVIGGIGADQINGGTGRDIVLGDNGNATFDDTGVLILIQTSDAAVLGSYDDIIKGFAGDNVIFGGNGNDQITTLGGNDVIAGDNGVAKFDSTAGASVIRDILSTDTSIGGNDTIDAGDGNNVVIAGYGNDLVNTGVGNDIAVGDSGHAVFNALGILTYITSISPDIGGDDVINVSDGTNVVIGGIGNDLINGGTGRDIVLGDNGNATFDDTGVLILLQTSDAAVLGNYDDVINGFAGDNVVFGGNGNDQVNTLGGNDVIAGDNAKAVFDSTGGVSVIRDFISTDPSIGGDDIINAGDGNNIVFGGVGNDLVNSGTGNDVVAGDNSHGIFNALGIMTYFTSINPEIGGDDVINVGDGVNYVIGGNGADQINGGVGQVFAMGDNGNMTFDDTGVLLLMQTSDPTVPGNYNDIINGSTGDNVIFGGNGNDRITTHDGNDVIAGDNAVTHYDNISGVRVLRDFISTDTGIGGDDIINGGGGNNIVFGGVGNDNIITGSGNDFLLGDNGHAVYNASGTLTYLTTISPAIGGNDVIHAGDGNNFVFGGTGNDRIYGGNGVDMVLGDNGYATFTDLGVLTFLTTTDESYGGDDIIFTYGGNDMIFGGPGNDYIDAGAGDDVVLGDFGYYNINLLTGNNATPYGVQVLDEQLGGNDTIFGGPGNDYLLGEGGNDYIDGGAGNDVIYGGYGDDMLFGGDGNDTLIGGPGGDFLDGGSGNSNRLYVDLFDEWAGGMGKDTIVGGPFYSTNNQLTFGLPALGVAGGQQPPGASMGPRSFSSANIFLTGSQLGIFSNTGAGNTVSGAGGGNQLAMNSPSSILVSSLDLTVSSSSLDHPRWSASSSGFAILASDKLGAAPLIGIGEFLQVQWSELLAQYH